MKLVLEEKESEMGDASFVWSGIGGSDMMEIRVSAATMPPMEWPTRMTRTEGSMVGDGVLAATSKSMTLFWSLEIRTFES